MLFTAPPQDGQVHYTETSDGIKVSLFRCSDTQGALLLNALKGNQRTSYHLKVIGGQVDLDNPKVISSFSYETELTSFQGTPQTRNHTINAILSVATILSQFKDFPTATKALLSSEMIVYHMQLDTD
jgi:hypothetical protein